MILRIIKPNRLRLTSLIGLFALTSFSSHAVQCHGSVFYHKTLAEALAATRDAKLNCCADSTITTINLVTGKRGLITIHEDGFNSSCFED